MLRSIHRLLFRDEILSAVHCGIILRCRVSVIRTHHHGIGGLEEWLLLDGLSGFLFSLSSVADHFDYFLVKLHQRFVIRSTLVFQRSQSKCVTLQFRECLHYIRRRNQHCVELCVGGNVVMGILHNFVHGFPVIRISGVEDTFKAVHTLLVFLLTGKIRCSQITIQIFRYRNIPQAVGIVRPEHLVVHAVYYHLSIGICRIRHGMNPILERNSHRFLGIRSAFRAKDSRAIPQKNGRCCQSYRQDERQQTFQILLIHFFPFKVASSLFFNTSR